MDVKAISVFEKMQALTEKETVEDMWCGWTEIADFIIPEDYEMKDALEEAMQPTGEIDYEWIVDRIDYLSDRATVGRIYWLDWAIRQYLGKDLRETEGWQY